jgi:hypothetical protein
MLPDQKRSFSEYSAEELEAAGRWAFKRIGNVLGLMDAGESKRIKCSTLLSNGYELKSDYFNNGFAGTRKISVEVLKGEKRAAFFTVEEGKGVASLEIGGVGLLIESKNLASSDHNTLTFFKNNKSGAIEIGDELVKWIKDSVEDIELKPLPFRLVSFLLPQG